MRSSKERSLHFFNSSVISWMYSSFIGESPFIQGGTNVLI